MLPLIALTPTDFKRWAEHMNRLIAEQGRDGRPFFSPMDAVDFESPDFQVRFDKNFAIPIGQPAWMRMWAVESLDADLIAHVDLTGSRVPSEKHRATLGIGVEERFYRQGIGRRLMQEAIVFARLNDIEWMDLYVFSENHAAVELYRALGFEEIGRRNDRFRLGGRSIDDLTMTLRIKG